MVAVKRFFGYLHIVVALAVAIQFLLFEAYNAGTAVQVWGYLNWFMAIAAIPALIFSYLRTRDAHLSDDETSDVREWIGANAMLIASAALFLLYFEQWFSWTVFRPADEAIPEYRNLVWIIIDPLFAIVNLIVGSYLLRITRSSGKRYQTITRSATDLARSETVHDD